MSENHQPAPQDCLEEAIASFRRSGVPDRPPDETVLARIRASSEQPATPVPISLLERIKRMNPVLRYGIVAAVVTCAVLLGIGRRSESIVLADVVKEVKKHKVVRHKVIQDMIGQPGKTMTMTVYLELSLDRMRMEMQDGQGNVVINILDVKQQKLIGIYPKDKRVMRMESRGTRKAGNSFLDWLEKIRTDKKVETTKEKLFGKPVIVYRLKEDNGKTDLEVYVDPKTKLPVQIEEKSTAPMRSKHMTMSDFVWDPKVDESTFSLEPPAGYEVIDVPESPPRKTKQKQPNDG